MEQNTRTYDEHMLMLYGQPFLFSVSTTDNTTGYANETASTLDGTNFDLDGDGVAETTPFLDEMIYIVGIRIMNDAANVFGGLQLDGRLVLTGSTAGNDGMLEHAAGQDIFIDSIAQALGAAGTDITAPPLFSAWGTTGIVCRDSILVWAFASGAGDGTDVWFRGFSVPRNR